ncbi:YhjD/YihY/BrkB family envelope integrity protein [Kitasatospora sp. NPDC096147]|uniref:YhjD/YihY/BrkB family envelope integrity protein n=1 Tax=Kitasatospora sp. NPDC096147 TaxID=3364093 RepID=UPI00382E6892
MTQPPPAGRDSSSSEESGSGSRGDRLKARSAALTATAKGLPDRVPLVGRAVGQLIRVNLLDNATRLAAQAFLSALPALFVVAVFAPASVRDGVVGSLKDQLGIEGEAQQQVRQLMAAGSDDVTQSFGVVGALVTLLSATALSRAMQRVCERCWELPKSGVRLAAWRWLAWLVVWLAFLVGQAPVRKGFGAGPWLGLPLYLLLATALWWWTQHLLLGNRVRWFPLLPGAVLCGVAVLGLGLAAQLYLPRAVAQSVDRFGPYGVVFTSLSWLIVLFSAVTLAISLGRVLAEEPVVARLLGTTDEPGRWGGRAR